MQIRLDPNPCIAGWGPCTWGFAHACERGGGHDGVMHICGQCGARIKDSPALWPDDPEEV